MNNNYTKIILFHIIMVFILIPFNNCSSDFTPLSSEDFSSLSELESVTLGKSLYSQHCASCHDTFENSTKKDRSSEQILSAFNSISAMSKLKNKLSLSQVSSIALALRTTKYENGRIQFACNNDDLVKSSIQRLSNRELKNTLFSILRELDSTLINDTKLNQLISELPSDFNGKKESTLIINQNLIESQMEIAFQVGSLISTSATAKSQFPNSNGCLNQSSITQNCASIFVKELGLRAFRRPLSNEEQSKYLNVFLDSALTDNSERIIQTASSIFLSPDFLYQIYNTGIENKAGSINLSSYEYASKISYLITGGPPDATLRSLAANNSILDSTIASQQLNRLIKTDSGKETLIRFFREWMHYDQFDSFNYSSDFLNGVSLNNLQSAMKREIDEFLFDTIINNQGTYQDLLTSNSSFIYDDSLANIYGITNPNGRTNLSQQLRAGLLTRAAFLSKRSGPLTSPVKRGLMIKEALLCEGIGNPPADAPAMLDPLPANTYLTTRERLEHLTMKPNTSCTVCHSIMNNLGFPFEMYDTLGRVRTKEKFYSSDGKFSGVELPINSASETKDLAPNPTPIIDALDLSSKLATNDKALSCLSKKWHEFHLRRTPASSDGCLLNETLKVSYGDSGKQGSLIDVFKTTITSEHFKKWNYNY